MNILFVTPSFPTRYHRIRAFQLIKYLSRNHDIFLLSLTGKKNNDTGELSHYCREIKTVYQPGWKSFLNCLFFLFSFLPLEVSFCRNKKMNALVRKIIAEKKIDLVYVKRLRSAQFVISGGLNVPVFLDTTDAMSLYYRRAAKSAPWYKKPLFLEEWLKYGIYEKKLLKKFKNWIVCSFPDAEYLKKSASEDVNFFTVPNGVDTEFYTAGGKMEPEKHAILFSGLMDKFVNIEAAPYFTRHIFPLVLKKIPDARLYITGPCPSAAIKGLASGNIIVAGDVPYIRDYILKSEVVVCPIRTGAGTKNKILQAWSLGRPVVATSLGAEGLVGENYRHFLVADKPEIFAEKIIELMRDQNLREKLVVSGYDIINKKYSMAIIVNDLNKIINNLKNHA